MTELIFMLTHHDITISNALEVFEEVKETGIKFVGCKDIGLSVDELVMLFHNMRDAGMTTFLEVVSHNKGEHFLGVEKALKVRADYLIGGMPEFARATLDFLGERETGLRFFPYIGHVVGRPCRLEGSVDEIVQNGLEFERMKADGVNILLYRYAGDVDILLDKLVRSLHVPIMPAGNIDSFERIDRVKQKGVWAFTIGGAIIERKFIPGKGIKEQVESVINRLL
jgi:hypothetical protein